MDELRERLAAYKAAAEGCDDVEHQDATTALVEAVTEVLGGEMPDAVMPLVVDGCQVRAAYQCELTLGSMRYRWFVILRTGTDSDGFHMHTVGSARFDENREMWTLDPSSGLINSGLTWGPAKRLFAQRCAVDSRHI